MDKPFISVIIPIYNVEKYLAECLQSVLEQDMKDAEFICVDDGSSDGSSQILAGFAEKDPRIRTITKTNGGLSSARNAGLEAAQGRWIMFLDSDDRLKEGAFSALAGCAQNNKDSDIIIFCADTFPADINSEPWYKKTLQFPCASYSSFSPKILFEERGAMPFVWRQAYRADFLKSSGVRFDESLKYGEDVQFQMEVFPQAAGFEFIEDVLYDYRLKREGSMMDETVNDPLLTVCRHFEMIRHVVSAWKEKGWTEQYGADLLQWILKFTILKVKALPGKERKEKTAELFSDIISPAGLDRFRSQLAPKGKMMWSAYNIMKKI